MCECSSESANTEQDSRRKEKDLNGGFIRCYRYAGRRAKCFGSFCMSAS